MPIELRESLRNENTLSVRVGNLDIAVPRYGDILNQNCDTKLSNPASLRERIAGLVEATQHSQKRAYIRHSSKNNNAKKTQAWKNLNAFEKGVELFKEMYPSLPKEITDRLETQINHYKTKGGRIRPFGEKELAQMLSFPRQWDLASTNANKNENIDSIQIFDENLSTILKNDEKFLRLATDMLAIKLKDKAPSQENKKAIKDLVGNLSQNKHISNREKIICMNSLIKKICHNQNSSPKKPLATTINVQTKKDGSKAVSISIPRRTKNIAFQGGGGKGVGYAGMLKVLSASGELQSLKQVGGSSAGALAATVVATGTKPVDFLKFVNDMQSGRDMPREEVRNYLNINDPEGQMSTMFEKEGNRFLSNQPLASDARGIIVNIDKQSHQNISDFLKGKNFDDPKFSRLNSDEKGRLRNFQEEHQFPVSQEDMVTFNDLKILSKIDIENNPFKELTITGWDSTNGKELYFNAENTPNMPIAFAARVSMSISPFFRPPHIDITKFGGNYSKDFESKVSVLFDGGFGSNSPSEMYVPDEDYNPKDSSIKSQLEYINYQLKQQNTMTAIFDEAGAGHRADSTSEEGRGFNYGTGFMGKAYDKMGKLAGAKTKISKNRAVENKKLDKVANKIIVGHGKLSTFNLNPSEEEKAAANMVSEAMTTNWVLDHEDEGSIIQLGDIGASFPLAPGTEDEIKKKMRTCALSLDRNELELAIEATGIRENAEQPKNVEQWVQQTWKKICEDTLVEAGYPLPQREA